MKGAQTKWKFVKKKNYVFRYLFDLGNENAKISKYSKLWEFRILTSGLVIDTIFVLTYLLQELLNGDKVVTLLSILYLKYNLKKNWNHSLERQIVN